MSACQSNSESHEEGVASSASDEDDDDNVEICVDDGEEESAQKDDVAASHESDSGTGECHVVVTSVLYCLKIVFFPS